MRDYGLPFLESRPHLPRANVLGAIFLVTRSRSECTGRLSWIGVICCDPLSARHLLSTVVNMVALVSCIPLRTNQSPATLLRKSQNDTCPLELQHSEELPDSSHCVLSLGSGMTTGLYKPLKMVQATNFWTDQMLEWCVTTSSTIGSALVLFAGLGVGR